MDPGQIFGDLREADLTRKIAPKIIPFIQAAGVEVQGVPLDLPLLQRIEWINNTGYTDEDVLVEVHVNDGNKRGIEAWFRGEGGNNSQKLAKVVVDTICEETGYAKQGIHAEHEHELRSLTFLNRTNPAALLLETLYIDNPEDITILKDESKLEELAKSIAKGILKYFGKDLEGKDLPEDQKPKYDDLKPVPKPAAPEIPGFGDDMDDFFGDMPGLPKPGGAGLSATPGAKAASTTSTMPSMPSFTPASNPISPAPAMPSFPSSGAGGFNPSVPKFGAPGAATGGNFMMDREQRREMIKKNYVKMLGREPTASDMNYFLNQGINEQDLIQKIVDSQEHQDLVKSKQKAADLEKKTNDQESEIKKLTAQAKDQQAILENLQNLLIHKNQAIAELEQAVFNKHGVPSSVYKQNSSAPSSVAPESAASTPTQAHRGFWDKIFHRLSKMLAK